MHVLPPCPTAGEAKSPRWPRLPARQGSWPVMQSCSLDAERGLTVALVSWEASMQWSLTSCACCPTNAFSAAVIASAEAGNEGGNGGLANAWDSPRIAGQTSEERHTMPVPERSLA